MWAIISLICLWETDPNAFLRSRYVNTMGRPWWMAFWTMADRVKICSIVPFIPVRNPFCKLASTRPLHHRNLSRQVAISLLKSFPMADVRAIGRKFSGLDGSPFLKMSLILAWHQSSGASSHQVLLTIWSLPHHIAGHLITCTCTVLSPGCDS